MGNKINKKVVIIVAVVCVSLTAVVGFIAGAVSIVNKAVMSYKNGSTEVGQNENGTNVNEMPGSNQDNDSGSSVEDGESVVKLTPTILYDNCGIAAFYTFVPEGWTATVNTTYTMDVNYPLQSDVVMLSPDGDYIIEMMTPMKYHEYNNQDGNRSADDASHDINHYTTLLHYRTASEYIDYLTGNAGFYWGEYKEHSGDSNAINSFKNQEKKSVTDFVTFMQNASDQMGGKTFNYIYSIVDYNAEIVSRRGMLRTSSGNNMFAEMTCYDGMYKYRENYEIPNNLIEIKNWNDTTYWGIQGLNMYAASNQELFDKNYDMAQFIINNSGTTAMYEVCKKNILDEIIPKIIDAKREMSDYIDSTVKSVTENFNQTNDRVAQLWDDYVLEQDRYTMSDGTQIVVPTTAEYVYYDGNDVLWSTSPSYNPGPEFEQIN